jgi:RNA polymerase sigma factor (TIGR02999 family)
MMRKGMEQRVTQLLAAAGEGDRTALEELVPIIYDHLRMLARARMACERPGHTLQATALVHEAYLRLFDESGGGTDWQSRHHFYAAAAEAMRRVLVDAARRRRSRKRGGDWQRHPLHETTPDPDTGAVDGLALDRALDDIRRRDTRLYDITMLRHLCGLTNEQTASLLGVSSRTVRRDWSVAQLCLQEAIGRESEDRGPP